ATHAVAAIVAQIAVAIADGNRATVVATGSVGLEAGELFGPRRKVSAVEIDLHHSGALQEGRVVGTVLGAWRPGASLARRQRCRGLQAHGRETRELLGRSLV